MKKTLSILTLIAVIVAGCSPTETSKEKVSLNVTSSIKFYNEPDWVVKVQSTTFNHVYDSISLTTTNLSTNNQTMNFSKTNSFNIVLSSGNYNMYMGTPDPKVVESYLKFTAYTTSVSVSTTAGSVSLPAETKQSLLLVTKTAVDSAPTLVIGAKTYTMFTAAAYYYAYINSPGPTTVKINMTISGKVLSRDITVQSKNRYVVTNPVSTNITSGDPMPTIIQI